MRTEISFETMFQNAVELYNRRLDTGLPALVISAGSHVTCRRGCWMLADRSRSAREPILTIVHCHRSGQGFSTIAGRWDWDRRFSAEDAEELAHALPEKVRFVLRKIRDGQHDRLI